MDDEDVDLDSMSDDDSDVVDGLDEETEAAEDVGMAA